MNIKAKVENILNQLGLSESDDGYAYLCEAICIAFNKPNVVYTSQEELYPLLEKRFLISKDDIEITLQSAMALIWQNADENELLGYFGYTADECEIPDADVLVAAIADALRFNSI